MERIQIETIFRNSKNSDELFDAFQDSVKQKIDDLELYKILFWNPTLNKNEVSMYIKKLAQEFPNIAYNAYMWGAKIIELLYSEDDNYEAAISFYKKAAKLNSLTAEPYIKALELYNEDLKIPKPELLITFLKSGFSKVKDPSVLYFKLGNFYGKLANLELKKHYISQGEILLKKKFNQ